MKTLNAIKADLRQHFGSETLTRHWFVKNATFSEGAIDYFQQAECFWLQDIIATECHNVVRALEPDVHYFEIESKDAEAHLYLKNYKGELLWDRHIDFTSHPEGKMELIIGWDGEKTITCLPSEN